jgi:helix-turn-helix protein
MSESVIADFVGRFSAEGSGRSGAVQGRVLLSKKRLVLAANADDKTTIPLDGIFDVNVGQVPPEMEEFFDASVTVAFKRGKGRYVAAIEADEEKIEKFSTVLFKAILNGTDTMLKHPARVGGRVMNNGFQPAKLVLKPGVVRFNTSDRPVQIPLTSVTGFGKSKREIGDSTRPVLEVRHMNDGQSTLSLAGIESPRKMSLLGRYLRLEYSEMRAELEDVTLSDDEKELLVALYSGAGKGGTSLAGALNKDAGRIAMLLNQLEEDDLIVNAEDGTKLTPKGRVVVSNSIEDVNV